MESLYNLLLDLHKNVKNLPLLSTLGTNIEIGYFDQVRQKLDLEKSVADNVSEGKTYVKINGKDKHIVGYLKGFLFSPKRSMTPAKVLSGGEKKYVFIYLWIFHDRSTRPDLSHNRASNLSLIILGKNCICRVTNIR